MSTNIGNLAIQLGLDSSGFLNGINGAISESNEFGDRFKKGLARSGDVGKAFEKGGRAQLAELIGGAPLATSPLSAAASTAFAAVDAFKKLGDSLASVVAYSNPGIVDQWTMAWDNLYAELGTKLAPLLEGMTGGVRALQDVIRSIVPDFGPLGDSIKNMFDKSKQGFLEADDAFEARTKANSTQQRKWFEDQQDYVKRITAHPNANLRQRLPFESDESYEEYLKDPEKYGSSTAGPAVAAKRPTFSAIDQVGKQSIVNAFQASRSGDGVDPASKTADNTAAMVTAQQETNQRLQALLDFQTGKAGALQHLRNAGV